VLGRVDAYFSVRAVQEGGRVRPYFRSRALLETVSRVNFMVKLLRACVWMPWRK
jgi:hypothetical protein